MRPAAPFPPTPEPAARMLLRVLMLVLALLIAWPDRPAQAASGDSAAQEAAQLVHLLDYIAVDYPSTVDNGRVVDAAEYAEQKEFAAQIKGLLGRLPPPAGGEAGRAELLAAAGRLEAAIAARAAGNEVAGASRALARQAIAAWQVTTAPRQAPDPAHGAALYARHCAGCHGIEGRGNGAVGRQVEPPPANFHDRRRMAQRSLHGLYNTIGVGVAGTAMPSYATLDDADRWALAFHIAGLAATPAELAAGEAVWRRDPAAAPLRDLATLTAATADELAGGPGGREAAALLAWLTRQPQALEALRPDPLQSARRLVADSVAALADGRRDDARRHAVAAYLDGFELAEAGLDAVDRPLRLQIEAEMMAFRQAVNADPLAEVRRRAASVDELLVRATTSVDDRRLSPTAAGLSALGILFREGLEAILVLAAIAAGVRRSGGSPAAIARASRLIHAGWIAALVAGAATWFAAEHLIAISGATREITEGVSALASAAILLYVGFWLHGKTRAGEWQDFLGGALSRGTADLLAGVAFLAVYREAFETVLFFEALNTQAAPGAASGIAAGTGIAAALLVATAWAVFRAGLRLPLALFFRVSAGLLAALAVVFAGQGVAALQEAGSIGSLAFAGPRLPALGIYPTLQTLAAQAIVLAAIGLMLTRQRRAAT